MQMLWARIGLGLIIMAYATLPVLGDPYRDLTPFEVNVAPSLRDVLSINIHFTNKPQLLDKARDAGFGWVRKDLTWHEIEKQKGVYNFSNWDRLLSQLADRNMRALLILDYNNPLYGYGQNDGISSDENRALFGNFVRAAAKQFAGKGVRYEIWNEPNYKYFWRPQPDPVSFAALYRDVLSRIRFEDSTSEVASGGLNWFHRNYLRSMLTADNGYGLDAIGVHAYNMKIGPEGIISEAQQWNAIKESTGTNVQQNWMTEFGYGIGQDWGGGVVETEQQHAAWTIRFILCAWASGFRMINLYDATDNNKGQAILDPEKSFTLSAIRYISSVAVGKTLVSYGLSEYDLSAVKLRSSDMAVTYVMWRRNGTQTLQLLGGAKATDLYGAPIIADTIAIAQDPVYISVPR